MKKLLLFFLLLVGFNNVFAQSVAHERCAAFQRGINLSNWLEAPWQTDWPTSTGYTKSDLQNMKDAGMHSLRLPINFAEITDTVYPFTVDTAHVLFQRIDSVIKWADELNMNLIIDNHHGWELTNENWRSYKDRFATMWAVVAKRYQNLDSEHYFFELLNEPPIAFNDLDSLNLLFNTAIDSIRLYTMQHSIVVSPNLGSWGMAFNLYRPLADTNLIYTWHCYDPIDFTHQGFSWTSPPYPSGTPFPNPSSFYEQFLYTGLERIIHWKDTFDMPLFLGEFGVSEHADAESRCRWMQLITHTTDSMQIPWFYWDWRWDFSMFNSHIVSEDSIIPCFKYALHLYSDTISGVEENALLPSDKLIIYPNPTASTFTVSGVNLPFTVAIFDVCGKQVYTGDNAFQHSVSNLSAGVYTLIISSKQQRFFRKLMKQ